MPNQLFPMRFPGAVAEVRASIEGPQVGVSKPEKRLAGTKS
jgi:hypothetical protein